MDVGSALRRTRKSFGLTQSEVSALAGVSRQAIVLLEQGGGRMTTLAKVTPHVGFRIIGIARGDLLHDQVKSARRQRQLTQQQLATRAGVSLPTVRAVEKGTASVASLAAVLVILAPEASEALLVRGYWQDDVRLTPRHPAHDLSDATARATPVVARKRSGVDVQQRSISPPNASDNDNIDATPAPELIMGDCLEVMKGIPNDSVDLILADLPYGVTGLDIDCMIPMEPLWAQFRRIIKKPRGNIVLFGAQPFTTALINAAPDLFKYPMVWQKNRPSHFQHSTSRPLGYHEDILVFGYGATISAKTSARRATFNPQGTIPVKRVAQRLKRNNTIGRTISGHVGGEIFDGLSNCPGSILSFPIDTVARGEEARVFAKPVELLAYLIRSYSNEGDTVLDCAMGTGSTMIAALRTGRRAIGIEIDSGRFNQAEARIEGEMRTMGVDVGGLSGGIAEA